MNLKNYKWKRGVLLIATALSFGISLNCCSKPKTMPLETIVREQEELKEQYSFTIEEEKESLEFAVDLTSEMSKEDIKEKITELIGYRIEKEVKEIVIENNFEYYAPCQNWII